MPIMLMACNHGEAGWWDARRPRTGTRQDAAPPTGARVSRRAAVHGGADLSSLLPKKESYPRVLVLHVMETSWQDLRDQPAILQRRPPFLLQCEAHQLAAFRIRGARRIQASLSLLTLCKAGWMTEIFTNTYGHHHRGDCTSRRRCWYERRLANGKCRTSHERIQGLHQARRSLLHKVFDVGRTVSLAAVATARATSRSQRSTARVRRESEEPLQSTVRRGHIHVLQASATCQDHVRRRELSGWCARQREREKLAILEARYVRAKRCARPRDEQGR